MSLVSCKRSIMVSSAVVMMMAASPARAIVINGLINSTPDADYQTLANTNNYASVGQFHTYDGANYAASGVVINANWVLNVTDDEVKTIAELLSRL